MRENRTFADVDASGCNSAVIPSNEKSIYTSLNKKKRMKKYTEYTKSKNICTFSDQVNPGERYDPLLMSLWFFYFVKSTISVAEGEETG
jgi:hypothetical protein